MNIRITISANKPATWETGGVKEPGLADLKKVVGGYLQQVPAFDTLKVSSFGMLVGLWDRISTTADAVPHDIPATVKAYRELHAVLSEALGADGSARCVVYCNEDGKSMGMPPNLDATLLWASAVGVAMADLRDVIVGDVVILAGDKTFLGMVP